MPSKALHSPSTISVTTSARSLPWILPCVPPNRRKEAIKLARREVWLSMPDRLVFCNILEKDVAVIDAYAGLDRGNEEFCQMWIQQKVDNAKGVV
jgi:hypothetical protein